MLQMQGVRRVFQTSMVETHALNNLTLHVRAGEFVAVTGPSGSGKTTLLNVAGLLEQFDAGSYVLDGQDVSRLTDRQRSAIRNERIGFVFQSFNLLPELNVYENVEVPLLYRHLDRAQRQRRVREVLERVGLMSRMKHLPGELSGGQQQRVAIARALAGEPRIILADEPTGNLDSEMSLQVMEMLEEINRAGTTILMVTHNPELAARASSQLRIMDGQVVGIAEQSADPPPTLAALSGAC